MDALREHIANARSVREGYSDELKMAFAFAGVELAELKAGIRSFKDCPGLAAIAHEIHMATITIKPADTRG